jgi:hypothetical protein
VFVFVLVFFLLLSLALLCRLCWLSLEPSHSQAGRRRAMVHRLLTPRLMAPSVASAPQR